MGDPLDPLSSDFSSAAYAEHLRSRAQPPTRSPLASAVAEEVTIDRATGRPRQSGADNAGAWVLQMRTRAERSLFFFCKAILRLDRLTKPLHGVVCKRLTHIPPRRKLILLPRDHYKTAIVSRGLPMHLLIQPKDSNRYGLPHEGRSTRILLAGEKAGNAENQLGWIAARFETNRLLRALWPQCVWDNPRQQARRWNAHEIMLPRDEDFPESSVETVGVGGVITGRHYGVIIKDDLISIEAANSAVSMMKAIEWHELTRALFDDPVLGLEFTIGTRWAVHDLYSHIIEEDPTVDHYTRAIIENGEPILPERFSLETITLLQQRHGVMFPLLYMNQAADPSLVDFNIDAVRGLTLEDEMLVFEEDERDARLLKRLNAPRPLPAAGETQQNRGRRFTPDVQEELLGREEFFRRRTASEGRPEAVPLRVRVG